MELYVIRHGKTDWNKEYRFQGAKDIPLNDEGRQSAITLSKRLETTHFDQIYSSPLSRAYETACIIKGNRNIPLIVNPEIIELSFGDMEGIPHDQWMNTDNPRKYFFTAPEKYVAPTGGESFTSGMKRTKHFVQTVIEPIYQKLPDARIMIVAHGAILAAMMCYLENRPLENYWGPGLKGNCEETIYSFDGKNWKLCSENKAEINQYVKFAESKKAENDNQ